VDAKKSTLTRADALKLAAKAGDIYATKGKKLVRLEMREKPGEEELAAALLGPTGNLRAPAAFVGKTLLVGFDPALYAEQLG